MYGLPADFDANFLVGRILHGILVQSNVIHLQLSDQCTISSGGWKDAGGLSVDEGELLNIPDAAPHLYDLLDKKVFSASGQPDGTLTLIFEGGKTIHVHDASECYESYQIHLDGKMIVLV
ncbi:MAG: hypothetical protein WBQ94_21825 [Terracidiphilus sp.]